MDERHRFWANAARWPIDGMGYVFLARAVHEVGEALFGNEWTGMESTAPEPYNLPSLVLPNGTKIQLSQAQAKPWQKDQIHNLLRSQRPDFGRQAREYGPGGSKPLTFSHEEWSAGIGLAAKADVERNRIHQRFSNAVATIVQALRDGTLLSALRPLAGGKMSEPLEAHLWNTEQITSRFFWCQMNPRMPFDTGVGGDLYQYIYVARDGLTALVKGIKSVEPTKAAGDRVKKFEAWLRGKVDASPMERAMSKREIRTEAAASFNLSERRADAARDRVLSGFDPAIQNVWRGGGAPRKASSDDD